MGTFKINEHREILNTGPVRETAVPTLVDPSGPNTSEIRQVDDRWRVDEPVVLIDHADVVYRNAPVFGSPERPVHVPTDHDLRPNPLNRHEQLAAARVLDPTRVQVEGAIDMTV